MTTKNHSTTGTVMPSNLNQDAKILDRSRALVPVPKANETPARKPDGANAVDQFLDIVKKLFGKGLTASDITAGRNNDIDSHVGEGEIVISTTTPDGVVLTARKKIVRRTLRWVRLWPYVTIVLALAAAILLVWQGDQIIKLLAALPRWR